MTGTWIGGLAIGLFLLGGLLVALLHPPEGSAVAERPGETAPVVEPEPEPTPPVVDGPRVVLGTATGKYGPIWGVRVTAKDAENASPLARVETDREGRYRIDLSGYDARLVDLLAERDATEGVLTLERRGLTWSAPGEVTVDFRWATPMWTRGRVVDITALPLPEGVLLEELAEPRPREGVRLFAVPADAYRRAFGAETIHPALLSRVPKETAVTDEEASFSFAGLEPGRYRVVVGSPDRMSVSPVEFEAGDPDVRVEILKCAGVAAWVFDAATLEPVPDARLVAMFPDGRRFESSPGRPLGLRWPMPFSPLEEGPVVRVEAQGYRDAELKSDAGGAQRAWLLPVLPANGSVVVRHGDGSAVEEPIAVRVRNPEDGPWIDLGQGPDGVFEFGLPAGPWRIEVSLPEQADVEEVTRELRVEPDSAWTVPLTVAGGSVILVPPDEAVGKRVRLSRTGGHADTKGDFAFPRSREVDLLGVRRFVRGLPAGRYHIEVLDTPWWQEVTVESGRVTVVDEWRDGADD